MADEYIVKSNGHYSPLLTHMMNKRKEEPQPQPKQEPAAVGPEWTPCMKLPVIVHVRHQRPKETHVSTREGITPVKPDDLIMRGVSGEEYPIGRAIFEQTYTFNTESAPQPQRECLHGVDDGACKGCYDDTALLRQALEALELMDNEAVYKLYRDEKRQLMEAIAALRERLK